MSHDGPNFDESIDWIEATVAGLAPRPDLEALRQGLHDRIVAGPTMPRVYHERRSPMWSWTAGLAVAVALVAMGVWGSITWLRPAQAIREFASATGSRSTIVLRDGTRVVLGPESRIRVPANFGRGARTVQLDGEAYFAVVHDDRHPFAVHVNAVTVTDVGTEFDVRGYRGDAGVRITVAQGRVDVSAGKSVQPLAINDMADVSPTGIAVTHGADIAATVSWMQGRLVFKNTPLRDAIRDLSRTFGLQIVLADTTLSHELVTGSFGNESADFILDNVTAVVGARYERQDKKVVIRRREASAAGEKKPQPLSTAQARGA